MNEKKICFIWNVQNQNYYQESSQSVDNLAIPEGYKLEKITITNKSFATAYNQAVAESNAKYKVYLQDSVCILNRQFLYAILNVFKNQEIGLLGILGAKTIPTSGIWQESKHKVGKIQIESNFKKHLITFGDIENDCDCEAAKVLEGTLLATQYDMLWRDDIFTGKYYYDYAQCIEFTKRGYRVVVVNQNKTPWCLQKIDTHPDQAEIDYNKQLFLESYSYAIYPLVSILIPTYNRPAFFKIALESALNQTYKNIEIIIGDDSTNEQTQQLIQPYLVKYSNIKYFYNNGPLGDFGYNNFKNIFEKSHGEYINYLMDDDIFHPDKIKIMVNLFLEHSDISLVTSYRQPIDSNGAFLPDIAATRKLFKETTVVNGKDLGNFILMSNLNVIGEPTTVLMRKQDIDGIYGVYGAVEHKCLVDMAQWLSLLEKGKAVYISDALSYFRRHGGQNQNKPYLGLRGAIDSHQYIVTAYQRGYFIDKADYLVILRNWLAINKRYQNQEEILKQDKNYNKEEFDLFLSDLSFTESTIKSANNNCNMIILDDYFPNIKTGFRVAEFNYYLHYYDAIVYSTNNTEENYNEYFKIFPENKEKINQINNNMIDLVTIPKLFYTVFLNNAYKFLTAFNTVKIPFIFTLYPGGGFGLNNLESDNKLLEIGKSPYLQKIIVTQTATYKKILWKKKRLNLSLVD
jgi:glycosyltransferase involved in cell wall biosynthesis